MAAVLPIRIIHKGEAASFKWVISSGLMSDVLTTEREEVLLVSSLTTTQVIRTADMIGANGVLIPCGKPLSGDTIAMAISLDITLVETDLQVFEVCLYPWYN
jgi:hypothetical protein